MTSQLSTLRPASVRQDWWPCASITSSDVAGVVSIVYTQRSSTRLSRTPGFPPCSRASMALVTNSLPAAHCGRAQALPLAGRPTRWRNKSGLMTFHRPASSLCFRLTSNLRPLTSGCSPQNAPGRFRAIWSRVRGARLNCKPSSRDCNRDKNPVQGWEPPLGNFPMVAVRKDPEGSTGRLPIVAVVAVRKDDR